MFIKEETESARNTFYAALIRTIVAAVCCFTPILVSLLAGVGLSAFTHYLDYVFFLPWRF